MVLAFLTLSRSGDAFIRFIGDKLRLDISYKNDVGFLSCFVLKSIKLKEPVFTSKDTGVSISCGAALIEPSFDELFSKKAILLECSLYGGRIVDIKETVKNMTDMSLVFNESASYVVDTISDIFYKKINAKLRMYGETVDFIYFKADSDKVRLSASGSFSEDGKVALSTDILLSPEITSDFPPEIVAMLTEKSDGWFSYSVNIETSKDRPYLKLESDRIKINFEKIEMK